MPFIPSQNDLSLCRYYVGVYNKQSKTVQLVDVPHIYALKQSVKSYNPTIKTNALDDMSWNQKQKMLLNSFGSKIKKKQLKAKEAGAVDIDTVSAKSGKCHILLSP